MPEATGFDVEIKFPTPIEEQSYRVQVLNEIPSSSLFIDQVFRLIGMPFVTGVMICFVQSL